MYAHDAGVVSRSPRELERMMTLIVTECATIEFTVSEAKTESMCLQVKHGGKV